MVESSSSLTSLPVDISMGETIFKIIDSWRFLTFIKKF